MDKQKVIICDLDGTLFDCEWRRKKYLMEDKMDFDAFNAAHVHDEVIEPTKLLLDLIGNIENYWNDATYCEYKNFPFDNFPVIVLVSGREEKYRWSTEKQIKKFLPDYNNCCGCKVSCYYALFMRQTGDYRGDEVIKKEIYEKHIKDNYDVLFCIDDRPKICRMWRELGLFCFQVNDKEF